VERFVPPAREEPRGSGSAQRWFVVRVGFENCWWVREPRGWWAWAAAHLAEQVAILEARRPHDLTHYVKLRHRLNPAPPRARASSTGSVGLAWCLSPPSAQVTAARLLRFEAKHRRGGNQVMRHVDVLAASGNPSAVPGMRALRVRRAVHRARESRIPDFEKYGWPLTRHRICFRQTAPSLAPKRGPRDRYNFVRSTPP
jgi:hypothetical protein